MTRQDGKHTTNKENNPLLLYYILFVAHHLPCRLSIYLNKYINNNNIINNNNYNTYYNYCYYYYWSSCIYLN